MNVLWLMVDQMRADHLGFAGHPYVRTPHLDRLAARGTIFENTFVQSPLCGPSRTSLFSGRYVHEHGVWWNGVPCEETAWVADHACATIEQAIGAQRPQE